MHDCRQIQDDLVELMFDETDAATRSRLMAQVEACAGCDAHYRSLAATLNACDAATHALTPRESYWPKYHAALSRRLMHAARDGSTPPLSFARAPFWKRCLTTSVRVPAPLAATAILLLVATTIFALLLLTARPAPIVLAAPAVMQESAPPQIRFIEVPIVREKIITQTVYVPRRLTSGADTRRRAVPRENLAEANRQNAALPEATVSPRANLSGFKPADNTNLRIIKGSGTREQ